ncbi:hypothetical protein [Flavobacterium aquiphilum]|uniref:hypothetical protein n=1 Tax=Flavobacterium aquiphilum TaxID=3003261 RepID=UPI0024807D0F|nr:hypothetical protein [Flavobacterium aquiphilum]
MKKLSIILCLIISSFTTFAQYEVKTLKRPDGITLKYFNPIAVAVTNNYEAGLSLYKNPDNNKYFVAISVLFKNAVAEELNGNLLIQTTGKNGISLKPAYNRLVTMNGREVALSMYYLTEREINELKSNSIKLISFTISNEIIALNLTENKDVFIKEFEILSNAKSNISKQNFNKSNSLTNAQKQNILNGTKTYDDYFKDRDANNNQTKLDPTSTMSGRNTSGVLGVNTDYGDSKYDKDINWDADIDENDIQGSLNKYRDTRWEEEWGVYRNVGLILFLFIVIIFIYRLLKSDENTKNNKEIGETNIRNEINPLNINPDTEIPAPTAKPNSDLTIVSPKPDSNDKELKRIGFKPSMLFTQAEPYNYPMVKMPKENSYIKFPRLGRSNKLGFTENTFSEVLNKYFKSDFKIYNDRHITHKSGNNAYEPDFLLINEIENKNIFINIEIDEPYDGISRIPTHEINRDIYRDLFFTNRGYIVIRFTEKQIFEEAKQCCVFIASVIKAIDENYSNKELDFETSISSQNQWDTLQAKKWSFEKYREKYLGIESFNPKSSSQIDFLIENSELDKIIELKIIEFDLSTFDKNDNKPLNGNQSHIRDKRIVFDSLNHRYYIDNNPDTISVSQLIDKFFPEFDALKAATNLNPRHELYGLPTDEIISIWEKKGIEAAELGTHLHLQIENYYKNQPFNSNTKEFGYFLEFKEQFTNMNPERTEWRIFDEDYMIAGTIDMLYKKEDGTFYIFDWKRSEKVVHPDGKLKISDPEHFYTKFASGELSHLTDDSYYRYALQQNIYRHILETKYNYKISSMNLLILHPKYETYHWVKLPKMQNEVDYMFSTLKIIS